MARLIMDACPSLAEKMCQREGWTPLHYCAQSTNPRMVETVTVVANANPAAVCIRDFSNVASDATPFNIAVDASRSKMALALLAANPRAALVGSAWMIRRRDSTLHHAVQKNLHEVCRMLLEAAPALAAQKDGLGKTAAEIADEIGGLAIPKGYIPWKEPEETYNPKHRKSHAAAPFVGGGVGKEAQKQARNSVVSSHAFVPASSRQNTVSLRATAASVSAAQPPPHRAQKSPEKRSGSRQRAADTHQRYTRPDESLATVAIPGRGSPVLRCA